MIEEKNALRKKYKELRNSIEEEVKISESERIAAVLFETDFYKNAGSLFIYVSLGSEVRTDGIIKKALADGKRVSVPLCNTELRAMAAIEIDSPAQLETGAYGIPEPMNKNREIKKSEIDIVIVPGLSFDKSGARLGYGGGYYDKFLCDYEGMSVGLCYRECLSEKLPTEEFDCRVGRIICPGRMI